MYKTMCFKDEFWYLCDSETMLPPLLSFRYCEYKLRKNAFSTQRAELQAVQFFYEFWFDKFSETLDYSLYKSGFQDIELLIDELEPFWEYLVAGRKLNLHVLFSGNVNTDTKKLTTHSTRCLAVIRFIKCLIDIYVDSRYTNQSKTEILAHRKLLKMKLETPRKSFQRYIRDSGSQTSTLHSLSADQCVDFSKVIRPSTKKAQNPLNPQVSQPIQIRNYLMWLLMLRYGLRVGEIQLLQKISFKPYMTDSSKFLMIVQNLEDNNDTRSQKPSIKTMQSTRKIDITREHYNLIFGVYYNKSRPTDEQCGHDFIFASSVKPYRPLSYRGILKEFERTAKSFKKNFPAHFNIDYSDAITANITPHWLRHTWAFSTLAAIYSQTSDKYINTKAVKVSGIMEDSIEQLRVLGGWSLKSRMPQHYGRRFIQNQANMSLLNIFNSTLYDNLIDEDIEF
ncbi:site-specific integrase [Shewanella sp. 5_MG-2023]|uniref:site-specific integrase n=1 Tax=Shewanella sp. 5_MG-2023 TaxID=3062656 RepID=UPI0026E38498|nr:site-specific integrase [Shewanella sp. 5_MG-2023]MDO6640550.1 site-specific integrase [Shewanella sp. 5_MG-2023]